MNSESSSLTPTSSGFALAAAITVVFNTLLACVKDAYRPLLTAMNAVGYHNWITQGIVDVILFFVLGLILSKTAFVMRATPHGMTGLLVGAVIVSALFLFLWYVFT